MKKVVPVKDFLWDRSTPRFEKGKTYELEEAFADQMVELGYAGYLKTSKVFTEPKEETVPEEKMQEVPENKMVDLENTPNKSMEDSKGHKKKKKGHKNN